MPVAVLDFETAWDSKDYSLSRMGPIEYIRDERFHAQLLGVSINGAPAVVYEEEDIAPAITSLNLENPDNIVVGHNMAGFDALVLSEHFGVRPATVLDTIPMMRWCGLSRMMRETHKELTAYLGNGVKTAGTVISDGKRTRADFTRSEWEAFKQYCADDVNQCATNFYKMLPYMTKDALLFISLTASMATHPGFVLDIPTLEAFLVKLSDREEQARQDLMKVFHFATVEDMLKAIRSPVEFAGMLRSLGVDPPMKVSDSKTETEKQRLMALRDSGGMAAELAQSMLQAGAYKRMTYAFSKTDLDFTDLVDHEDERVSLLVRTRLEQNSSGLRSRTERFLSLARTGVSLPIILGTFMAHTSRYTTSTGEGKSDGINVQNLGKRSKLLAEMRKAIKVPDGMVVVAGDSSQVEARMLAYEAGQQHLLEQFRDGRDPYAELAEYIFHVPAADIHKGAKSGDSRLKMMRNVGKTGILSAGYGVSAKKFSDTLLRDGIRLDEDLEKHREMAAHAHNTYRQVNSNIVQFWRTCEAVLDAMYQGKSGSFGGPNNDLFSYGLRTMPYHNEPFPSIALPSGYILWYPHMGLELAEDGRSQYFYMRHKGKAQVKSRIYGAMLAENLTQALAFQLLMWQACGMAREHIVIHANIHDAWASVVLAALGQHVKGRMEYWLSQVPPWLEGMPVACEVEIGTDYSIV